ncbi:hypothetical protein D3C75_1150000 [compost metagenome]
MQLGQDATVHGLDDLHPAAGNHFTVCPCDFVNAKIHRPYNKPQHQCDDAPDKPGGDSATVGVFQPLHASGVGYLVVKQFNGH